MNTQRRDFGHPGRPSEEGPTRPIPAPVRPTHGSPGRRFGAAALALLSALVLVGSGVGWYELRLGGATSSALDDGAPKSTGGDMNLLLIGLDSRKDQNGEPLPQPLLDKLHAGDSSRGGYNTNTLILIHIPADRSKATAFSIPRDSYVSLPDGGKGKIKEAYGRAKAVADQDLVDDGVTDKTDREAQSREAGREATLEAVRTLTGVPIDHFAEVNLAGFYHVADALGEIPVCLKEATQDDNSGADFAAGRQLLDAEQALSFVRQRNNLPRDDLSRTERQQAFLAGVSHQLHSTGAMADPGKLRGMLDAVHEDVVIDAGWDLLSFAEQVQGLTGDNMRFQTLPVEEFATVDGAEVNIVDPDRIRETVRTEFGERSTPAESEPELDPEDMVEVLNGNGASGLAAEVADQLADGGATIGGTGNAAPQETTEVLHHPNSAGTAEAVAKMLGGVAVRDDPSLPDARVRVVLGTDYDGGTPGATNPQPAVPAPTGGESVQGDIPCVY